MKFYEFLICVATVNGPKRLEDFILSVVENTKGINYAISITDDCSDPGLSSQNYAIAAKYDCYYIRNAVRSGVPFSWNKATEAADAKYLVISNDDIILCPGWLNSFKIFLESNSHLKLGVIAWPAVNDLSRVSSITKFMVGPDESHITNPVVACSGYLFAITRELFVSVGRFDERYFATWEEIDFGAKLCMNGYKSIGLAQPFVYHQGGASFSDPINQHPSMQKQSIAQSQWIEKWSTILNINSAQISQNDLIREISLKLIEKIPQYSKDQFNLVPLDLSPLSLDNIYPRDEIHGWFDWDDIYRSNALRINSGTFVEVGSWMGKSACFLSECIKHLDKKIDFHCVDIWDDNFTVDNSSLASEKLKAGVSSLEDLFVYNMTKYGVQNIAIPRKGTSELISKTFKDRSIDMVFLDAAHDYESVKLDLESWYPKLKVGATFGGHDYFWSPDGVKRAVDEFCLLKNLKIKTSGQCWYIENINE